MLTKIVVKLYAVILEVGLWLLLLVGSVGGWQANGFFWWSAWNHFLSHTRGSVSYTHLDVYKRQA